MANPRLRQYPGQVGQAPDRELKGDYINMVRTGQGKSNVTIHQLVERALAGDKITAQEHLQLTSAILSDSQITDEDRRQINRIFESIQMGRLKLVY